MTVLKHLVGYMAGHAEEFVSLKWKGLHSGLLRPYECHEPDWTADRGAQRSVSGAVYNLLWRMRCALKQPNSEDRVTVERRE